MSDHMPVGAYMDLLTRCRKAGQREICGFLLDDWTVLPGFNVANAEQEFEIDAETTLYAFQEEGDRLMGVYHSHPSGNLNPSQMDINHAPDGLRYFIVTPGEIAEWVIADGVAARTPPVAG